MDQQRQEYQGLLEDGKLNSLRQLLIGLDNHELERLQLLIRDPHAFAAEISDLLPYAIRRLVEKGEITIESLLPIIEDTMHKSVQRNPSKLADILFPVMGPAIRKAVSEDLKRMIAAINTSLEAGLSPKSIKWRLQALMSKRSYTEIVLANTYIFHVSHVFLIHRESGILLHQEVAAESQNLESDMISAMLTAIRDFVKDSFHGDENANLENVQVGTMNIFVEQGPYAILAAIVEGNPPADFRLTMTETIEAVHFNHAADLEKFEGTTKIFLHTSKFLKNCLVRERKKKKNTLPWPLIILLLLIVGLISWFSYQHYAKRHAFQKLISQIENTNGYHITQAKKDGKTYHIKALRDPDAINIDSLLNSSKLPRENIHTNFEKFISLDSSILISRAIRHFQPPESVNFSIENQVLIVTGTANSEWIKFLNDNFYKVTGINEIDISRLNESKHEAPNLDWIIPEIERKTFVFDINVTDLDASQKMSFDSLVKAAIYLDDFNQLNNKSLKIYVRSYTSRRGNLEANLRVAIRRAEAFAELLRKAGLKEELLEAQVKFVEETHQNAMLRSVQFEVFEKTEE